MDRLLLRPGRLRSFHSAIVTRASWGFTSCRRNAPRTSLRVRGYADTGAPPEADSPPAPVDAVQPKKPYYVTTPIFYVNAAPHIGHMYSMILADVLKRWFQLQGQQSLLLTGTDEHGMKIQQAAAANDQAPQAWCDAQAALFRDLALKANLANDFFIRTTDADHKDAVRHFWFLLQEKGLVYEKKHEGWYCVSDETFYPAAMVARTVDPLTGKVSAASAETGNVVEWTEEKNYHFRMTALKDQLLEFYRENPQWVVPKHRMQEVVDWVENSLEDLSISRPSSRLDWGIRVPGDDSQTIYVWVDALINYLTKAGFPNWAPGAQTAGGWPADVHVIGKDILRFHGVYWPALLLAVDIAPPKKLLSHAHWLMSGKKMSKSRGNVVNPFFAMDRWGVDTMRFFMVYDGGLEDDANYDNTIIADRYNKMLRHTLGNLLNRVCRPNNWSVEECVREAADPAATMHTVVFPEREAGLFKGHESVMAGVCGHMHSMMEKPDPRQALLHLVDVAYQTNKLMTNLEPWQVARKLYEEKKLMLVAEEAPTEANQQARALLNKMVYTMADTLRVMGIVLQPFMPGKAAEMLDVLGVSPGKRTFEYAALGRDFAYGKPLIDISRAAFEGLFPKLYIEEKEISSNL